jgi:nitrosocyanin
VHNFRRFILLPLIGFSLVLSGCGGHATLTRSIDAAPVSGGAGFDPVTVTVHKDDNVVLNVGNTTAVTHGFSVEGYGIHDTVDAHTPIKVKFKAGKPGTFKIFCQLHPAHQTATLVVQ